MIRLSGQAILIAGISFGVMFANWNDTSTGIRLDQFRPFPLTKIRSGFLKDGSRTRLDGISAIATSGDAREVILRGSGTPGKRWEVHLLSVDEVWRGDLDVNGKQDYIFFSSGPYFNGRTTPLFSLSILLMDLEGMPIPFFTTIYKGEHGEGVKSLVRVKNDGHAGLLISSYDEDASDPGVGSFCSGHWVTQLFRFTDLAAEEVKGTLAGTKFPFIHNWSYGQKECGGYHNQPVAPATIHEFGTMPKTPVVTTIKSKADDIGAVAIQPVWMQDRLAQRCRL